RAERKLILQALSTALLDTDRSHKTAIYADEKKAFSSLYLFVLNAGSGERPDIVNAGSGETEYSECRVRGERI
ncbi:unnamed protein product, partial [Staurois parvus]